MARKNNNRQLSKRHRSKKEQKARSQKYRDRIDGQRLAYNKQMQQLQQMITAQMAEQLNQQPNTGELFLGQDEVDLTENPTLVTEGEVVEAEEVVTATLETEDLTSSEEATEEAVSEEIKES